MFLSNLKPEENDNNEKEYGDNVQELKVVEIEVIDQEADKNKEEEYFENGEDLKVDEEVEQEIVEVNYVDAKKEEGFSFEVEDKIPNWIKEKVEDFKFDMRKEKISEIKIDFRVEKDEQSESEKKKMTTEKYEKNN